MKENTLRNYAFRVHSDGRHEGVTSHSLNCDLCSTTFNVIRKNDMYVVSDYKTHFSQLLDISGTIQIIFDESVETGLCPSCVNSELNKYLQFSSTYEHEPDRLTAIIEADHDSETSIDSISVIGDSLKLQVKLYFEHITDNEEYLRLVDKDDEKLVRLPDFSIKLQADSIPEDAVLCKVVVSSTSHSNYFETEFKYSILSSRL